VQSDPELATLIAAWAGLPSALRAGILVMVQSVCKPTTAGCVAPDPQLLLLPSAPVEAAL
jgi:hypothetical protein